MSGTTSPQGGLTRRSFLKTTGAVAGAAALAGSAGALEALAEESGNSNSEEETLYHGVCRGNCMGGCPLDIFVRDGKVARVQAADCPDQRYKRICLKGLTHPQRIYSPDRIMYPLKRVEGTERGAGEWERISWDEAIDAICSKWKDLRKEYGTGSIGFWKQSGSFGLVNGSHYFAAFNRLANAMKASTLAGAVDMSYYTANTAMYGGGLASSANEATDYANAQTIIVWGSNLTEAQIHVWHFIADAIENGAKLIVIDPSYTVVASKAHMFVPVRPGSDAVLALAMAKIMLEEDLVDWDFVKKSTVAPLLVKEDGTYLREGGADGSEPLAPGASDPTLMVWDLSAGKAVLASEAVDPAVKGSFEVDGQKVTPAFELLLERINERSLETASEMCEVPVETMREIVHLYTGNKPSSIFLGFGPDRYYNGHSAYTAIGAFAMLSGNIGKPGASAGVCQYNSLPLDGAACTSPIRADQVNNIGDGLSANSMGILALLLPDAIESGMYNNQPFNLKSIYVHNCNPLNYVAERKALLDVFNQMDLVVVSDIHMTDTARYADIILPIAHWFEVDDFTCGTAFLTPFVVLQEKAIDPPGECKSDYEILNLLAEGMDMPGVYGGLTPEEAMRYVLDTPTAAKWGVSYDRLKEEKIIDWFPEEDYIFAADGKFTTPTGRAQFYFEKLAPSMSWGQTIDEDLERLPFFVEPQEAWPDNPLHEKYPLTCYQEHTRYRVHSNFSHVPWLRELDPEPTVKLSRVDAEARGIEDGDMVKVFNDRGHVVVKAVINDGIKPGTCNIPKGWQLDQFVDGHYQDLTSRATNPYVANSQFSDLLVEIEKN